MKLYKNTILSGTLTLLASLSSFAQVPVAPVMPVPVAPAVKLIPYQGDTFDKIKKSGKIIIGNRSGSIPISFFDENKKPIGYGIDICLNIVERIKEKISNPNLQVQFVEVNSTNRIPMVIEGKVDLECGSTTNNASRRKEVDFSIPYYVAGIRLLTKKNSGINSLNDLRGKKVALSEKTSSIPLIEKLNKERDMKITLVIEKDFSSAFNSVSTGKSEAFVLDDLLLFGERSKVSNPKDFVVVGDFLSVEPLAIMLRKDDTKFKTFVDKELTNIITSGQINIYYKKWFQTGIPPKNQNLNIPQSPLLKDVFRMPTSITGN